MRKIYGVTTALLMIVVMLSGCNVLEKIGLRNSDGESEPVSHVSLSEEEAKKLNEKVPVLLYFGNKEGTKLVAERRYILKSDVKTNLPSNILKELIAGPTKSTGLKAVIPEGTKANGTVKVEKGIASVDLSKEFIEKLSKDKNADSLAIFSIVNSLTEIKEISKVNFTIDGAVKNQVGRFVFNSPFQRSESIIDKNAKIESTGLDDKPEGTVTAEDDDQSTMIELTDEELEEVFRHEEDFEE